MGNICRSPTAEAAFRRAVEEAGLGDRIETDSAGTHDYHIGEPPDPRTQQAARRRGLDLSALRGRQVSETDFHEFGWIVAMDRANLRLLEARCPPAQRYKLSLLLEHAQESPVREVPDPYYGGEQGFEHVLDLVEQGAAGLLEKVRKALDA
jgi:protein-tyrosine phosphatase